MTYRFDEDPMGAVLEFALLLTDPSKRAERTDWEKTNLGGSEKEVWEVAALTRAHLIRWLSRTRDVDTTRRRVHRVFMMAERDGLIEPRWQDDDPSSANRSITLLAAKVLTNNTLREHLLGLPYVAQKWRHSLFKIYKRGGAGIGTGFLVRPDTIATARHVIDELGEYEVSSEAWPESRFVSADAREHDDRSRVVAVRDVTRHPNEQVDLALLHLEKPAHWVMPLRIAQTWQHLEEVVILGYPPVPQAQDSYLLVARGEVNADITSYAGGQRLLIISCLPRGGFSGGPVLNRHGEVIGIITRSLLHQSNNLVRLRLLILDVLAQIEKGEKVVAIAAEKSRLDNAFGQLDPASYEAAVGFLAALPSQSLTALLAEPQSFGELGDLTDHC